MFKSISNKFHLFHGFVNTFLHSGFYIQLYFKQCAKRDKSSMVTLKLKKGRYVKVQPNLCKDILMDFHVVYLAVNIKVKYIFPILVLKVNGEVTRTISSLKMNFHATLLRLYVILEHNLVPSDYGHLYRSFSTDA